MMMRRALSYLIMTEQIERIAPLKESWMTSIRGISSVPWCSWDLARFPVRASLLVGTICGECGCPTSAVQREHNLIQICITCYFSANAIYRSSGARLRRWPETAECAADVGRRHCWQGTSLEIFVECSGDRSKSLFAASLSALLTCYDVIRQPAITCLLQDFLCDKTQGWWNRQAKTWPSSFSITRTRTRAMVTPVETV